MQKAFSDSPKRVSLSWIAVLRIMLGMVFDQLGQQSVPGLLHARRPGALFLEVYPQSQNPLAFYAAFIHGVILPIGQVFAPFSNCRAGDGPGFCWLAPSRRSSAWPGSSFWPTRSWLP
jgi:hypothetical protein